MFNRSLMDRAFVWAEGMVLGCILCRCVYLYIFILTIIMLTALAPNYSTITCLLFSVGQDLYVFHILLIYSFHILKLNIRFPILSAFATLVNTSHQREIVHYTKPLLLIWSSDIQLAINKVLNQISSCFSFGKHVLFILSTFCCCFDLNRILVFYSKGVSSFTAPGSCSGVQGSKAFSANSVQGRRSWMARPSIWMVWRNVQQPCSWRPYLF